MDRRLHASPLVGSLKTKIRETSEVRVSEINLAFDRRTHVDGTTDNSDSLGTSTVLNLQ